MMNKYDLLIDMLPVIYPEFYKITDADENELIFLDLGNQADTEGIKGIKVADKTQTESFINHVHLFGRIKSENKDKVTQIALAIAKNIFDSLILKFPDKKFIVYVTVNPKDSTIIRFHQCWDDEAPYIDTKDFFEKDVELHVFQN